MTTTDTPCTVVRSPDRPEWEAVYNLPPREAVRAAYAQSLGDYNTWDYSKYDGGIRFTKHGVTCGPFWAAR